jgi:hypothetical protein
METRRPVENLRGVLQRASLQHEFVVVEMNGFLRQRGEESAGDAATAVCRADEQSFDLRAASVMPDEPSAASRLITSPDNQHRAFGRRPLRRVLRWVGAGAVQRCEVFGHCLHEDLHGRVVVSQPSQLDIEVIGNVGHHAHSVPELRSAWVRRSNPGPGSGRRLSCSPLSGSPTPATFNSIAYLTIDVPVTITPPEHGVRTRERDHWPFDQRQDSGHHDYEWWYKHETHLTCCHEVELEFKYNSM